MQILQTHSEHEMSIHSTSMRVTQQLKASTKYKDEFRCHSMDLAQVLFLLMERWAAVAYQACQGERADESEY
jgi:hypothetical protein